MKQTLSFLSWLTVLLLWACAATVYVNPSIYGKYIAVVGLCFPFFVVAVMGMGVLCLLIKPRLVFISIFGLLCCFGSLRDYCPINLSSPPPKKAIKVISYNTMSFGCWRMDDNGRDVELVRYLCTQQPDIAALQETAFSSEDMHTCIQRTMKRYGYHFEWIFVGGNRVGVMSKWPIARQEVICHSTGNGAAAFYVTPRQGDTIIVVCAHLESMHLSNAERDNYHDIVRNPETANKVHGKLGLVRKIANSGAERARQVDTLCTFIDRNADRKLLVMGDFNDSPISYAHHSVCSRLTDTYRATANGIGRSFNRDAIYVRIDNIFCSQHFKPYAMKVDQTVPFSDHYPMIGYLKEQTK